MGGERMIRNKLKRLLKEINVKVPRAIEKTGIHGYAFRRILRNELNQIGFETLDALCTGLSDNKRAITVSDILEHVPDDQMTPEDAQHVNERSENVKRRNSYRK